MTKRSHLTERDLFLVAHGLWPIDCDRPLNGKEIEARLESGSLTVEEVEKYRPCIKDGYLFFEKRNK